MAYGHRSKGNCADIEMLKAPGALDKDSFQQAVNAMQRLAALGGDPRLRLKNGEPFRTDEGNFVIDCPFSTEILSQPEKLDQEIRGIAGVVEHGLFRGMAERLIVARGNPKGIQGLADLQRPDVLFVNRQRGAGTRVLLDYNLARSGISADRVRGYTRQEPTHTAVAMAVEEGTADCGLGVLAAARATGLDFVPLFHERFDLVIPVEHYESALLQPLLVVLRQQEKEFVQQVAALGGYATGLMGKVLAEM